MQMPSLNLAMPDAAKASGLLSNQMVRESHYPHARAEAAKASMEVTGLAASVVASRPSDVQHREDVRSQPRLSHSFLRWCESTGVGL